MESLKVYALNITALISTSMPLNTYLQTLVLLCTLIYTILQIISKAKSK